MQPEDRLRSGDLQIRSVDQPGARMLVLIGELDAAGCPRLESELARVEASDANRIILDLKEVEFIDSTALGFLVAAMRRSDEDSGRLRFIRSESLDVQRLLELCGLDQSMPYV